MPKVTKIRIDFGCFRINTFTKQELPSTRKGMHVKGYKSAYGRRLYYFRINAFTKQELNSLETSCDKVNKLIYLDRLSLRLLLWQQKC
jgi:hypothetical protein